MIIRKYGCALALVLAMSGGNVNASEEVDIEGTLERYNRKMAVASEQDDRAIALADLLVGLKEDLRLPSQQTKHLSEEAITFYKMWELEIAKRLHPYTTPLECFMNMSDGELGDAFIAYLTVNFTYDDESAALWKMADLYKKIGYVYELDGDLDESGRYCRLARHLLDEYYLRQARVNVKLMDSLVSEDDIEENIRLSEYSLRRVSLFEHSKHPLEAWGMHCLNQGQAKQGSKILETLLSVNRPIGQPARLMLDNYYLGEGVRLFQEAWDMATKADVTMGLEDASRFISKVSWFYNSRTPLTEWALDCSKTKEASLAYKLFAAITWTGVEPMDSGLILRCSFELFRHHDLATSLALYKDAVDFAREHEGSSAHEPEWISLALPMTDEDMRSTSALLSASYFSLIIGDDGSAAEFLSEGMRLVDGNSPLLDRNEQGWAPRLANYMAIEVILALLREGQLRSRSALKGYFDTALCRVEIDGPVKFFDTVFGRLHLPFSHNAGSMLYDQVRVLHEKNLKLWNAK